MMKELVVITILMEVDLSVSEKPQNLKEIIVSLAQAKHGNGRWIICSTVLEFPVILLLISNQSIFDPILDIGGLNPLIQNENNNNSGNIFNDNKKNKEQEIPVLTKSTEE